ncbi:MAG: glyoxalase [Acidimicrobiales bacterium]|nr:glyoxalase [Acidimicrobiales bacterium]
MVAVETKTVLYPVRDVEKAKSIFSALLGMEPTTDSPYYIGFHIGDQEIGLLPQGHNQGMTGQVTYYEVADISESLSKLVGAGAEIIQGPMDVGAGLLVATLKDLDGNVIGLRQPA